MSAHHVADEAQAEAAAGRRVPLCRRAAVEGLEDPLALVARDARPPVLDPKHDGAPVRPCGRAHAEPAAARAELDHVRHEVVEGAPPAGTGAYAFGDVRVDFRRAEVTRGGAPVDLSSLEFKLLRYFVEHRGALVSRQELLEQVWGYPAVLQTRTVDVHVASLRQKLEQHPAKPEHIVTVHRMGYRFVG